MGRSNGHFIHADLEKRIGVLLSFFLSFELGTSFLDRYFLNEPVLWTG